MNRYLSHLARETHSRMRPPKGFRLGTRAPATFEEIYEERIVGPEPAQRTAPAPRVSVAESAPPVQRRTPVSEPEFFSPRGAIPPLPPPPQPAAPMAVALPSTPPILSQPRPAPAPETAHSQSSPFREPPVLRAEAGPARPPSPPRIVDNPSAPVAAAPETLVSSLRTLFFPVEPEPASPGQPRAATPLIPEPIRTRSGPASEPAPEPALTVHRVHTVPSERRPAAAPQPAIDVTIGTIEVAIESPPPTVAASRRSQPRASEPRPLPPSAGMLARMYLDR